MDAITVALGLRPGDLFPGNVVAMPWTTVDQAWFRVVNLRDAVALARRQPGYQDATQHRYLCHEVLKFIDRERATQRDATDPDWERLAELARLETETLAVLEDLR